MGEEKTIHHYFVDETGDLTLFAKRRHQVLVGKPGCSKYFMLGVVQLPDPDFAHKQLETLRQNLLADPYFRGVPSMQPDAGKTFSFFHAKNDLPEVRREMFKLLPSLGAKVQVGIRRKDSVVNLARILDSAGQRITDNHIYDDLVKRLFKNLLHKADENLIVFARRGKSKRHKALNEAISKSKSNFERKWGPRNWGTTRIHSGFPCEYAGLQIIDYYLWTLNRLYEREEDRFFNLLRPGFRLIMDLDDKRNKDYGEWYSDSNPLELRKIKAFQ